MSIPVPGRILVVGSGAREHVLAWRLAGEPGVREVHVAPGNPGMTDLAVLHPEADPTDHEALIRIARSIGPDLVMIGPEAPLAAGLADRLHEAGIAIFGPSREAARLESSKSFCRSIARAAGIPMAEGASFDRSGEAIAFARALGAPLVVKADGLAAGKGVTLCPTLEQAEAAVRAAVDEGRFGAAGGRVVVERQLFGREASLMAICDGSTAVALPPSRDHKRIGDGDTGPNTGGMGAYSPLPDLPDAEAATLSAAFQTAALAEMARREIPFRGLLYAGLMLTSEGPRLLEFNVRFGDPEAQAVLPRVAVPLAPLLLAAARGRLARAIEASAGGSGLVARNDATVALPTRDHATVALVLAAAGYPGTPASGDLISGLDEAEAMGALVFHAATAREDRRFVTAGGRVLSVVASGQDLATARARAYEAASRIAFRGMQYRHDIGATVAAPRPPATPGTTLAALAGTAR